MSFFLGDYKSSAGNALVEYGLPMGLIVVVLALGITTFPTLLQDWFANTVNGNMASDKMSVAALGKPVLSAQMRRNLSMLPPPRADEETVCTDNYCVNLPIISPNTVVETAGGNGGDMVTRLSAALQQLITQLREEGADESLIALIEQLANEGHSLADIMAQLKAEAEARANSQALANQENANVATLQQQLQSGTPDQALISSLSRDLRDAKIP